MEARENPLSAAFGSRVSAADADSAEAREVGAENAIQIEPQSTGGFAQTRRAQRFISAKTQRKNKSPSAPRNTEKAEAKQERFDTKTPRYKDTMRRES